MTRQLAHGELFTDETFEVLRFQVGGEYLDRHHALECGLGTPIDNAESATSDLSGIGEPGGGQLCREP